MRRIMLAVAAAAVVLAACGQDTGESIDTGGKDLQVITKTVEGVEYRCLYVYRDGGYDGGPALWCERLPEGEQ